MSAVAQERRLAWERETAALGMWVFVASELMFFGALFLAYLHVRIADPVGVAAASHHTHEWLGTINTAILLTSSLSVALAAQAFAAGERRGAARLLAITAALGLAFLGVKGAEYALEWNEGLVPGLHFTASGPRAGSTALFFFLYFLMTGVHALHLAIGIAIVAWFAARMRGRSAAPPSQRALHVLGLYWHFVDGVWVFLYPLFYLVELYR